MAGAAVTFLSVKLAHVILRLRVARENNNWIPKRDGYIHTYTYIQTISEIRSHAKALDNYSQGC